MTNYTDSSVAITRSDGYRLQEESYDEGDYLYQSGCVATPDGHVQVIATWVKKARRKKTHLMFIHRGREWTRHYDNYYQPRYVVTLCARFAAEVVAGQVQV